MLIKAVNMIIPTSEGLVAPSRTPGSDVFATLSCILDVDANDTDHIYRRTSKGSCDRHFHHHCIDDSKPCKAPAGVVDGYQNTKRVYCVFGPGAETSRRRQQRSTW